MHLMDNLASLLAGVERIMPFLYMYKMESDGVKIG